MPSVLGVGSEVRSYTLPIRFCWGIGTGLPRLRSWHVAQAVLKGVSAAVALILGVAVQLVRDTVVEVESAVILLVSLVLLLRYEAETWWLVWGGAAMGALRLLVAS